MRRSHLIVRGIVERRSNSSFNEQGLEHLDALFGYAMTLTRDRNVAEDLVQETYLRAVRAANQLSPESNIKSWLFVIMRNAWLNQLRHQRSGPRFVDIEVESNTRSDLEASPHVVYLRKLERAQVQDAMERLPEAYREIVLLRDFEGFTYQEIATVLDCPAGTVMSRLARAREKLRQMLTMWQPRKKAKTV
jgi:RNA polymerase sigma-70 factor, ECF subfamily